MVQIEKVENLDSLENIFIFFKESQLLDLICIKYNISNKDKADLKPNMPYSLLP